MNTSNELSPSAFIPFCQFGEDTSLLGITNPNFKFPICNSFKPKILENQLCYQIDLNEIKKNLSEKYLSVALTHTGLILGIDPNPELNTVRNVDVQLKHTLLNYIYEADTSDSEALIHIGTLVPLKLSAEGNYGLTNIKEIEVTDKFLILDDDVKNCQNKETYEDCITNKFLESLKSECNCVPFNLRNFSSDQVNQI